MKAEEGAVEEEGPQEGEKLISSSPRWLGGKEPTCQCRRQRRRGFNPWVRKIL